MNEHLLPTKSCCPAGSIPFLKEDPNYVPKGSMVMYHGVNAYQVGNGKKCLLIIHDIFGLHSGMHKIVCDTLADSLPGYIVIAPDFFPDGAIFGDDPLPQRGSGLLCKILSAVFCRGFLGYIARHSWYHGCKDIFDKSTTYLTSERGVEEFALMGFCWGAYIAFKACADATDKDKIFCNISCHPSVSNLASTYKEKEIDVVNGVNCPQFVASSKDEAKGWKPRGTVEKALATKPFSNLNEFYVYEKEFHGFVVRGDTKIEATRIAIENCLNRIVNFLHKFN